MSLYERLGLWALHRFRPEPAHKLSLIALQLGLVPLPGPTTTPRIATELAGLKLANPIGLAAGYDKNAIAVDKLARAGFGFIELGAITPRPQPGNPRPRLFRLSQDRAAINRMGFNNDGMAAAAARLARRAAQPVPVGLNLGANKDSDDRAGDFARVLAACGPYLDFVTVNVSSPNTERLRELQGPAALRGVLDRVLEARAALPGPVPVPVLLKIAPDLAEDEIEAIAEVARAVKLDGIVATNTTLSREGLKSEQRNEPGGLSGPPLFEKSTRVLAKLAAITQGEIPLVGVGGISNADEAYAKITAGASALQLYTALIYQGTSLVGEIARGLDERLARDGYTHISQAVGTKKGDWL